MSDIKEGGLAFPGFRNHETNAGTITETWGGMSLRDWFAATIQLTPLETTELMNYIPSAEYVKNEAEIRYRKADAMLKERDKK